MAALKVPASPSKALKVELFPEGIPVQKNPQGDSCLDRDLACEEGTCGPGGEGDGLGCSH